MLAGKCIVESKGINEATTGSKNSCQLGIVAKIDCVFAAVI